MMNRVELKEDVMEKINGGKYLVFANDTDQFIASYTFRPAMERIVHKLNACGMDLKVKTTNWMDDEDAAGVYLAADMRC